MTPWSGQTASRTRTTRRLVRGAGAVHRCNLCIDRCRIWLGLRMPPALGTTVATCADAARSHRMGRPSRPSLQAASNSGRAKTRGTSMDTTSIVTSHPALAESEARLQGGGTCRRAASCPRAASTCAPPAGSLRSNRIRSTPSRNPTKVVQLWRLTSLLKKRDPRRPAAPAQRQHNQPRRKPR